MFLGSREIQAVSASRSKVMHTADFTPEGQVMGGRMRLASSGTGCVLSRWRRGATTFSGV